MGPVIFETLYQSVMLQFPGAQVYKKGSAQFRPQIDEPSRGLPGNAGNIPKDNLPHWIIGTDIKHIKDASCMKCNIQACGSAGKQKKESPRKEKVLRAGSFFLGKNEKKTQKNH